MIKTARLHWYFAHALIPSILILLCFGVLYHIFLIILYGAIIIGESLSPIILWAEVALFSAVITYCVLWLKAKLRVTTIKITGGEW